MNNDLISRSALLNEIYHLSHLWEYGQGVKDCKHIIENAPTVETPCEQESELIKAYTKGFNTGVEIVKNARLQGEFVEKLKDRIQESICNRCPMNNKCVLCEISRVFQIITLTAEELKGGAE